MLRSQEGKQQQMKHLNENKMIIPRRQHHTSHKQTNMYKEQTDTTRPEKIQEREDTAQLKLDISRIWTNWK